MEHSSKTTTAITLSIITVTLSAVLLFVQLQKESKDVCESVECVTQASRILKSMDLTADPCNDFYQYACGGWIKNNPIPETRGGLNNFVLADEENKKILRGILNTDHTNDRDAVQKAKMYYKGCINEERLEQLDVLPVFDLIDELGGLPLFDGGIDEQDFNLEEYLAQTRVYDTPILSTTVYVDVANSSKHIIYVQQPNLILPDRAYYLNDIFNTTQEALKQYLRDYLDMLWKQFDMETESSTFDADALHDAVEEIFNLEKALAEIIVPREQMIDLSAVFTKMTFAEMPEKLPGYDWSTYFETFFGVDVVGNDTEVGTLTEPYLTEMMQVLQRFSPRVIQNYVVVYHLTGNLDLLSKKYRDSISVLRKAITGAEEEEPRWKVCLSKVTTNLPMAVGTAFAKATFSEDSREKVLEMTDLIFESFTNGLDELKWMDDETKKAAKRKIKAKVAMMVYPEYIVNDTNPQLDEEYQYANVNESEFFKAEFSLYENRKKQELNELSEPVDRSKWFLSPASVNAYYDITRNALVFPAGILQPPFFNPAGPFAANFGAIGEVIAHELSHGFDKTGSAFNDKGSIENWWTMQSRLNYMDLEKCFVEQYNNYIYETAGKNVSGELTVGENVADNGGIRHTYHAYQMWKEKHPNEEFSLPGLEDHTAEQVLFLSYAQMNCAAERKEAAIRTVTEDVHSPFPIRVLGPLQNFGKFGEAYQCKVGRDKMLLEEADTCALW